MSSPTDIPTVPGALTALAERGFALDGEPFSVRRPDRPALPMRTRTGARVVVKLFAIGEAERMFANMQAVWHSAFGTTRATPAMAQPLDCLSEIGAVVMALGGAVSLTDRRMRVGAPARARPKSLPSDMAAAE